MVTRVTRLRLTLKPHPDRTATPALLVLLEPNPPGPEVGAVPLQLLAQVLGAAGPTARRYFLLLNHGPLEEIVQALDRAVVPVVVALQSSFEVGQHHPVLKRVLLDAGLVLEQNPGELAGFPPQCGSRRLRPHGHFRDSWEVLQPGSGLVPVGEGCLESVEGAAQDKRPDRRELGHHLVLGPPPVLGDGRLADRSGGGRGRRRRPRTSRQCPLRGGRVLYQ